MYSVISVIVDSLPGNTKNRGIDPFVVFGVRFSHSWADTVCVTHVLHCVLMQCIVVLQRMYCSTRGIRSNTAAHVIHCNTAAHVLYCNIYVAILQYNATHCNTLQHTHTHTHTTHTHTWNTLPNCSTCNTLQYCSTRNTLQYCSTYDVILEYTALHRNTLQHTATHYQHVYTHEREETRTHTCNALQCTALQRTATRCNTLLELIHT